MSRRSARAVAVTQPDPAGRLQNLLAGLWVAAVVGVLLLGAILRGNAPDPGMVVAADSGLSEVAPLPGPIPYSPPQAVPPTATAAVGLLESRVESDLGRLLAEGDGWTAQLAVMCDASRVESMVREFGHHESFHVVPTYLNGDPCFLLCWNRYTTRDTARAARDLPSELRAVQPRPMPKRLSAIETRLE